MGLHGSRPLKHVSFLLYALIPCRDGDPAEKLRRKIKTITDLSGDGYDQFTESVAVEEENQDDKAEAPTTATGDQDLATINKSDTEVPSVVSTVSAAPALTIPASTSAAAANTRIVSPQAIYAKLWYGCPTRYK